VADVLKQRLFRSRIALCERWDRYYRRAVLTVAWALARIDPPLLMKTDPPGTLIGIEFSAIED
jgi:hypothetical protein